MLRKCPAHEQSLETSATCHSSLEWVSVFTGDNKCSLLSLHPRIAVVKEETALQILWNGFWFFPVNCTRNEGTGLRLCCSEDTPQETMKQNSSKFTNSFLGFFFNGFHQWSLGQPLKASFLFLGKTNSWTTQHGSVRFLLALVILALKFKVIK